MESKLIEEIRLKLQLNELLKQIECQLEYPVECNKRCGFRCRQCIYNVGSVTPICSKTE